MIEIKNTKVGLYTVEEYKNYYNVSVLIPEMERILELSKGKEIILISRLVTLGPYTRYVVAIPTEDYYECGTINSDVIREVIADGLTRSYWEKITTSIKPKPPLGIAPKKLYEEMANTARINDLWNAMDRYIKEGCKILPEWVEELKERYKMVEEN